MWAWVRFLVVAAALVVPWVLEHLQPKQPGVIRGAHGTFTLP